MSIVIDEHLLAMWFAETPTGDWMAGLSKSESGGYELKYRFRHYTKGPAPLGVWDGSDRKSWYGVKGKQLQPLIDTTRLILRSGTMTGAFSKSYELLRGEKTTHEFVELLRKQPFAHSKKVTKAEYERFQRDGRIPT